MFRPHLTDLIDIHVLQRIQDGFSEYTKMAALTADANGIPITRESGFTRFCTELTRQSPLGCRRCNECDRSGALETLKNGKPSVYYCHAGLIDYASPIMVENHFIGCFIGGQVHTGEIDPDRFRATAKELNLDPEEYVSAAKDTYVSTMENVAKAAGFLYEISRAVSEMAYKNYLELQKSSKLEKAARSQSIFIMDVTQGAKKELKKSIDFSRKALESRNTDSLSSAVKKNLDSNTKILSTIEDAIEYVKMSGGEVELIENKYKVKNIFSKFRSALKIFLRERMVDFSVEFDESVPEYLLGDSEKIWQIVYKLVFNSLNYMKNGEISIKVSCKKICYATMLNISIFDTSKSISAENLNTIMAHLKNENVYYPENPKNSNLGFYVIGLLVKQMSGKITVESGSYGSVFKLSFPQLEIKEGGDF